MHVGKAAHVLRKADQRMTLAQLLQHSPRPLGEVLLEATHNLDVLMRSTRETRLKVLRREEVTADEPLRLVQLSQAAHALAEQTVKAGVQVELVKQARLQTALDGEVITRVLGRALDALTSGPRAPLAPLGAEFVGGLRVWLHEVVRAELEAVAAVDDPDPDRAELVTGAPVMYPPPPALPGPG